MQSLSAGRLVGLRFGGTRSVQSLLAGRVVGGWGLALEGGMQGAGTSTLGRNDGDSPNSKDKGKGVTFVILIVLPEAATCDDRLSGGAGSAVDEEGCRLPRHQAKAGTHH